MRQEKQGQSKPGEKQSHCSLALTPGRLCWLVVCLRVGLDDRIRTGRVQFRRAVLRKSDVAEVMLNDGGPYDFVLDTAAQVTTIDPELAGELHLKLLGGDRSDRRGFSTRASYARLQLLQTGDYRVKDSLLLVRNLGQVQVNDRRVRGILGENFLEHFDLMIDYAHGIVCLDDTKKMQEKVKGEHIALATPLHPERNLPFTEPLMIPVRARGVTGPLLLLRIGHQLAAAV